MYNVRYKRRFKLYRVYVRADDYSPCFAATCMKIIALSLSRGSVYTSINQRYGLTCRRNLLLYAKIIKYTAENKRIATVSRNFPFIRKLSQ